MSAFKTYWTTYGGWRSLFLSPYFLFSGLAWAALKPLWFDAFDGSEQSFTWVEKAIIILPSMVSFSLGALAIFLAFSNETFLKLIRKRGASDSYLMAAATAFFHFILIQFVALALCLFVLAYPVALISGIAFFVFCYALSCGVAAAAAVLDMAEILNAAGKFDK